MERFLGWLGGVVHGRPGWLLAAVVVATVVLGVFATQQEAEVDITAFAPDTELANAFERVQDEFQSGGGTVQIIVDAGAGGDVLSPAGLEAAERVRRAVLDDPQVAESLAEATPQAPAVVSFATPLVVAVEQQGSDPSGVGADELDQLAGRVLSSEQGSQVAGLLSRDRDLEAADARAGIVLVRLSADLDQTEQQAVSVAIRDAVDVVELPGTMQALPFSQGLLFAELESGLQDQLPFLLGLSLLLILAILAAIYRTVSDVITGLVGLVVSIVWMYGFGVLLGPDYLGVTGNFSQIAIVIPVLLVGLGIDYAIHLTSRYREEIGQGAEIDSAARRAVTSVGGALVLATITTIIGFATNWFTPLPPIQDFGLFTAFGVLSAFIVMISVVPATRHLLDRRPSRTSEQAAGGRARDRGALALSRAMSGLAVLTERAPGRTLAVAAVVTALAAVGGTQLSTAFSQRDFIPEDSYAELVLDRTEELFGGDLTEQTYVLVDGDVTDPSLANAMLQAQQLIGDEVEDGLVRRSATGVQVRSAPQLVAQLATGTSAPAGSPSAGPQDAQVQQLQAALTANGWTDAGFAPDADMAALYGLVRQVLPGELERLVTDNRSLALMTIASTAGEDRAEELAAQLQVPLDPIRDTADGAVVVSEPLVVAEILDAMTASQIRSIVITLVAALLLLVGFYGIVDRRPLLGAVTMVPSVLSVAWVLGAMYMLGLSFNVLTSTIAALAIGIGVPYGIHITHRFVEDRQRTSTLDEAMRATITHTGGALAGSAATTAIGFGVLVLSELAPIRQFGGITALTIIFALAGSVLVQPSLLALWDRRDRGVEPDRSPAVASEAS